MRRSAACAFLAILVSVAGAAAQTPSTWRDDLSAYYRAEARKDEPEMLRLALRLAEARRGPRWSTIVGDHYWYGRGTAVDPAEAVKWYRRAAVRGGDRAMLALARAYHHGNGAERDQEAAYFWVSLAASRRNHRAMLEHTINMRRGVPFAREESQVERQISQAIEFMLEHARGDEESRADAMPARRATYVRAFRILACPWAAPPDHQEARRFLQLAIKEGWNEGESFLPRFEQANADLSGACERD